MIAYCLFHQRAQVMETAFLPFHRPIIRNGLSHNLRSTDMLLSICRNRLKILVWCWCVAAHLQLVWISATQVIIVIFFWPSLSVISRDSKNYAMQRSWNGRQSSCWTKLSCSKITLNRWIKIESRWYKQLASLLLLFIIIIILFKSGNNKVPLT